MESVNEYARYVEHNSVEFAVVDKNDNILFYYDKDKVLRIPYGHVSVDSLPCEIKELPRMINYEESIFPFALLDSLNNILLYYDNEKQFHIPGGALSEDSLPGRFVSHINDDNLLFAVLDKNDNIILAYGKNRTLYIDGFLSTGGSVSSGNRGTVCERNSEKQEIIENDAVPNVMGESFGNPVISKRLQLMITTDTHELTDSFKNAIDAALAFSTIDAVLHLGDFGNNPDPGTDNYSANKKIIDAVGKPLFMTPGNHDVGTNSSYVRYCKSEEELYERFVKPSVDRGFLKSGEYQENKCYYYHDFTPYNLRLIMLYPYDSGDEFDTNYWEPVAPYDSSYDNLAARSYTQGEYVNIPGHTKHSFFCKEEVAVQYIQSPGGRAWTENGGVRTDYHYEYNPRYKMVRYYVWYRQAQLDWLVVKLNEAKSLGYDVIIAQHYPLLYGGNTLLGARYATETRFHNPYRGNSIEFEVRYDINPDDHTSDKNIIAQIVDKYINGGTINKTVYPYGKKNCTERHSDLEGWGLDDATSLAPVTLNYRFDGGGRVLFLNGHNHSDCIAKSDMLGMTQIGFLCGTLSDVPNCDIVRTGANPKKADTATVLTMDHEKVHLTRLGIDTTIRVGSDGRLIRKDNEIIVF